MGVLEWMILKAVVLIVAVAIYGFWLGRKERDGWKRRKDRDG